MKALVEYLSGRISASIIDSLSSSRTGELRRVFHGPCRDVLEKLFEQLSMGGGIRATLETGEAVTVPVLLQVNREQAGGANPPLNASGKCDPDHLVTLRNNPSSLRFFVLLPPGAHPNLSISSASDEFGVGPGANSGNATIDDWLGDGFIKSARDAIADRLALAGPARQEFFSLFDTAARYADDLERHGVERSGAWALMARLFDIPASATDKLSMVSLACGVPPRTDGTLGAELQVGVLRRLSSRFLEKGVRATFAELGEAAEEDVRIALAGCLASIEARCYLATQFSDAPTSHYRPGSQWALSAPPPWWNCLTADIWAVLLEDEEEVEKGEMTLRCTNSIASNLRSVDGLTLSSVTLELDLQSDPNAPATATLARTAPGRGVQPQWSIEALRGSTAEDTAIPSHRTPLRYQVEVPGFQKASARVISLATWEPGVVIDARTAKKVTLPKRVRGQGPAAYEATLILEGAGRHYLDAYVSEGVEVAESAECTDADGDRVIERDARVTRDTPFKLGFDIEATGDCTYELAITRPSGDAARIKVVISCEEASPEGCSSEFERLIRLNRQGREARVSAEVLVDRSRATVLQSWALDETGARVSCRPLVLGPDLAGVWRKPDWSSQEGSILSRGRFLCDPRPSVEEMRAPERFVDCRARIAAKVLGDEFTGLLETAKLGEWAAAEQAFRDDVASYVAAYSEWLAQEPEIAPWSDVLAVCGFERDGQTLAREPDAIILSPLHPMRLAWHVAAQRTMWEAHCARDPSPAASILDPRCIPDVLHLPVQTTAGSVEKVPFFAVDQSSDYWSVLWNTRKLSTIPEWSGRPPFDREFGLQIGGVASGFSVAQVCRAMDDISEMRSAKPTISVVVASAAGQTNACNEGLMEWGRTRLASVDLASRGNGHGALRTGPRRVQILDQRAETARPDDAKVANLAEDTDGALRWMDGRVDSAIRPDLGIIAQLESAGDSAEPSELRSPLAAGALLRHRVRRQLAMGNGAFLMESRSGIAGPTPADPLLASLGEAVERLERMGDPKVAYAFAPSVRAVQAVLERADFATVSSSAIDPACFLGGWLGDSYLWDYELPSYSRRAGDSNGYYLLSKVKSEDTEALTRAIATLPGGRDLPDGVIETILKEVASRGIPTVRGLSSGDHGASGDLGLFVAARLLQDEFRTGGDAGLLRLTEVIAGRDHITLVIPVDPFQGYLEDLQKALGLKGTRPDLLVASFDVGGGPVRCKLTPVEVKFRSERRPMAVEDRLDGLKQAKAMSELLTKAGAKGAGGQMLWRLTIDHLLVTMIGYGLRVYSQKQLGAETGREWARRHEQIISAVFGGDLLLEIDTRGRLVVVDSSPESRPLDLDGDGFAETIAISLADACTLVREAKPAVAAAIRSRVGHWEFLPSPPSVQTGPVTSEPEPALGPPPSRPEPPAGPAEPTPVPGVTPEEGPTPQLPSPDAPPAVPVEGSPTGIRIHVGLTQGTFKQAERSLSLSDTQLNQLNMGVVGDLGTGKTQFLKSLIYQLSQSTLANRGIRPRMLILDYKKDYVSPEFVEAVGAKVIKPSRLPLNLFDTAGLGDQSKPWLQRFRFFADTLSKIYSGIGPVQLQYLKDAVKSAYEARPEGIAPTLVDVRNAYGELLKGKYDSPYSIIDYLVESEVFDPAPAAGATFGTFLDGIVVLSLGELGQDDQTKNMLVAVMLNMFYEHMLTFPKRPYTGTDPQLRVVDSFLLVDEADNIMKFEFDVLRKLLLQGREFGVGVILASQYLRHFKTQGTDYREPLLSWFIHKVPNVTAQELGALGLVDDLTALVDEVKRLPVHHCLFKTVGVPGDLVRATPFFELIGKK